MAMSLIKEETEHILRVLPFLLKKDEKFRYEVAIVLSEVFATKNEFQKVLEEIKLLREDGNRQFEEINHRFEEMDHRIEEQGTSITKAVEKLGMSISRIFEMSN